MARNQSISVYFGFGQFLSVFGFPKRDFQNPKSLTVIIYKKQSNRATERDVEEIRTTEKEKLPTIFVQQFTYRFQHKIENILN